ncbi:hypothetical protein [Pseudomonas sp. MWU12-2345]|uniref:hypothetical protein n=1 Tax=Pseudomonas sp. MWU12-2345 TaxID=2928689 RepID=UPI00200E60DA|nr:hypothetical protein [Pseudomonas sp. MWU12-2345]
MAEKVLLPLDDQSDDTVMRLSRDEARALYELLSRLTREDMVQAGLSPEQAGMIDRIIHVTY